LPRGRRWLRRIARFFSWIGPGAVLALIPKCPACLAAYISVGTGIGVSLSVAENLRIGLVAISVAALSWLLFQLIRARVGRISRARERDHALLES
jgi:hypothetical protein